MSHPASADLIFEHPLNERMRTFLRLEHLFEKVEHFLPGTDPWSTRASIEGLLDVIAITARADIKAEIIKELDRNQGTLGRLRNQPGVDPEALQAILTRLGTASAGIHALTGAIGAAARDDEFLKAVAQRNAIPGGACSFDLPFYHYLLTRPPADRDARLRAWMQELTPVAEAIRLVLSLARDSARPRRMVAQDGFFQEALDLAAPAQLVRVGLAPDQTLFAEISGHKNRFSIRFVVPNGGGRPQPCHEPVPFSLTCCVL